MLALILPHAIAPLTGGPFSRCINMLGDLRDSCSRLPAIQELAERRPHRHTLWTTCLLTGQPLVAPVAADWLGRLFNRRVPPPAFPSRARSCALTALAPCPPPGRLAPSCAAQRRMNRVQHAGCVQLQGFCNSAMHAEQIEGCPANSSIYQLIVPPTSSAHSGAFNLASGSVGGMQLRLAPSCVSQVGGGDFRGTRVPF